MVRVSAASHVTTSHTTQASENRSMPASAKHKPTSRAPATMVASAAAAIPGGAVHGLPLDLKRALAASASALRQWRSLTPLARNEFICWCESAKLVETRARRVCRALEELDDGLRRPCCWPGCAHRERTAGR